MSVNCEEQTNLVHSVNCEQTIMSKTPKNNISLNLVVQGIIDFCRLLTFVCLCS